MTKQIRGFENYTISTEGEVVNTVTGHIKACTVYANGYRHADLSKNNAVTKVAVHRLVALHFISNTKGKRVVNHIDGNKLNNNVSNLEWNTDAENAQHAYDTGLNKQAKLFTEEEYLAMYNELTEKVNITTLAKKYNCAIATLSENLKVYVQLWGNELEYAVLLKTQKLYRAKQTGKANRSAYTLQMLDVGNNTTVMEFDSYNSVDAYFKKNVSGSVANVIAGRQKTAAGFKWRRV